MTTRIVTGSLLAAACCLAAGCAGNPIKKDLRMQAGKDLTFERVAAAPAEYAGKLVIWGGYIVSALDSSEYTELNIVDTPLDSSDEPEAIESSRGRFLARVRGFLDPAVYTKGRKITVAGKVAGQQIRPLGKRKYSYPVLEPEQLYLWPRENAAPEPYYYYPPVGLGFWYEPYFYGYGGYLDYGMDDDIGDGDIGDDDR